MWKKHTKKEEWMNCRGYKWKSLKIWLTWFIQNHLSFKSYFHSQNVLCKINIQFHFCNKPGKQWSGLVNDYYVPRWRLFFKELEKSILSKQPFESDKFKLLFMEKIGRPFCTDTHSYPSEPTGDTLAISTRLFEKWIGVLRSSSTKM